MTAAKLTDAAKWLGRRIATGGLYILAIVGATSWTDGNPNWAEIFIRLGGTAIFLSMAVRRSVGHWHEDQEDA
jgi:hypothetical protein